MEAPISERSLQSLWFQPKWICRLDCFLKKIFRTTVVYANLGPHLNLRSKIKFWSDAKIKRHSLSKICYGPARQYIRSCRTGAGCPITLKGCDVLFSHRIKILFYYEGSGGVLDQRKLPSFWKHFLKNTLTYIQIYKFQGRSRCLLLWHILLLGQLS